MTERVRDHILLEIALSLGGESEPDRLLEASLPLIAKRTASAAVGVVRIDERAADEGVAHETVAVSPKALGQDRSWRDRVARVVASSRRHAEPTWRHDEDDHVVHAFRLPGYGVLLIVRSVPLDAGFVQGFRPLAEVLARPLVAASERSRRLVAERSVASLGARQRGLLDALPFPAWLLDEQARYVEANQAFCELLGCETARLEGLSPSAAFPDPDTQACEDKVRRVLATGVAHREQGRDPTTGGVRELHLIPQTDAQGRVLGCVGLLWDVTERHDTQRALEVLSDLRELLVTLAVEFVNTPLERIDAAIDAALARTGGFVEADRAYVFRYDFASQTASNTHEWCAPGIEPMIEHLQQQPMQEFPDWLQTHLRGEELHFPDVQALPEDHEARLILEPQGVLTNFTIPMVADGDCLGFVGFDAVRAHRSWSDDERHVLAVLAELIANAEQRRRREADLVEARAEAEAARGSLELALSSGSGALWHYDFARSEGILSGGLLALAGREPVQRRGSFELLLDLLGPDEALRLDRAFWDVAASDAERFELDTVLRHEDGTAVPVRFQGAFERDAKGRPLRAAGTAVDLTHERQEAERTARRLRHEALLMQLSARFLNPASFEDAVHQALADLGDVHAASRAVVIEIDEELVRNAHEWCAPGVPPARATTPDRAVASQRETIDVLARGETLVVDDVAGLPDELATEREVLEARGTRSLVALPLLVDGELTGAVALEHTERAGAWSEEDLGLLRSAAELLAGASARARAEQQLVRAREAAEGANASKDWLLSTISHELRTPVNGVIGMTDLVLGEPLEPDQRRRLETARSSAESLLAQLDDLLDVARMESGRLELRPEPTDLRRLAAEVTDLARVEAEPAGLMVSCTVGEDVPERVHADAARLRQILTNLVGNAVKFTDAGYVTVEVEPAPRGAGAAGAAAQGVRIRVIDTGRGVPAHAREEVFRPFVRAEGRAGAGSRDGSGLGLAVVRWLVELMEGTIRLDDGPAGGTAVELDLPLAATTPAHRSAPDAAPRAGLRVLLVDDDPVNREILSAYLEEAAAQVRAVETGEEAVEAAMEGGVDLVLLDCFMPGMDGFAAARAIRSRQPAGQALPIVAITADGSDQNVRACAHAGMDEVLVKPVRREDVLAALWLAEDPGDDGDAAHREGWWSASHEAGAGSELPVLESAPLEALRGRRSAEVPLAVRLTDLFVEHAPSYVAQLHAAAREGDAGAFRIAAHTLKSNAATLGLRRLQDLAREAEAEAKRGEASPARLAGLAGALEREVDRGVQALDRARREGWLEAVS